MRFSLPEELEGLADKTGDSAERWACMTAEAVVLRSGAHCSYEIEPHADDEIQATYDQAAKTALLGIELLNAEAWNGGFYENRWPFVRTMLRLVAVSIFYDLPRRAFKLWSWLTGGDSRGLYVTLYPKTVRERFHAFVFRGIERELNHRVVFLRTMAALCRTYREAERLPRA